MLTVLTARVALLLYAAALGLQAARTERLRRAAWSFAYAALLLHVVCAFWLVHGWSHAQAYEHTRRVTAAWTGWNSGAGLYWNYAVLVLWAGDLLWWYLAPLSHAARAKLVTWAIHGFLLFMYFQAAVVFAPSPARWWNLAVLGLIPVLRGRVKGEG